MKKLIGIFFLLLATIVVAQNNNEELKWPREIVENGYKITLYQAQLESLAQNILNGRMALSIKKDEEIIFGAMWFNARLATDLDSRTAVLEALQIPEIKFPDVEDESKIEDLKKLIIEDLESIDLEMSLDRILADLDLVKNEQAINDKLNNNPPEIYFRTEPTVIVIIDGEPILKEIEKSKLEYVVNTPFLILKKKKHYYIKGGNYWYESKTLVTDDWTVTKNVPNDVEKTANEMMEAEQDPNIEGENTEIPDLIVTTKPSEIITSNGKLEYEPVGETSLLYVKNSENDILLDINSQQHFVLINGRWYSSKTMKDKAWAFVEPENLPKDFASIPDDSSIASVKVSVPGTEAAKEAMYEQQMPQTAVVDRKTATTKVVYDGSPKFEKMDGTTVQYATNTESTVIKIDNTYYCVDNGIWFESSNADGPWAVSDERPSEVDDIPPSAPVYNVKYVYIYDSTPEVVYVGYTPGYYYSYMYGGVVVYGTGYYYNPWYGRYYYPRPVTYGYGVHYNPYTGWGFSAGFSYGWFSMSFYSHPMYWGPCGYRHGYRHGYHYGYHRGYHNGYGAGYANGRYDSRNVYKQHRNNGVRPTSRDRVSTQPANRSARPSDRSNNMYTDRNGNIYKRDNNGSWSQQNKRSATRPGTQPDARPGNQPSQRPSTQQSTRPSTPSNQLQLDYQNRNRGTQNYNNYQNYQRNSAPTRSAPIRSAPSGGGRMRR